MVGKLSMLVAMNFSSATLRELRFTNLPRTSVTIRCKQLENVCRWRAELPKQTGVGWALVETMPWAIVGALVGPLTGALVRPSSWALVGPYGYGAVAMTDKTARARNRAVRHRQVAVRHRSLAKTDG